MVVWLELGSSDNSIILQISLSSQKGQTYIKYNTHSITTPLQKIQTIGNDEVHRIHTGRERARPPVQRKAIGALWLWGGGAGASLDLIFSLNPAPYRTNNPHFQNTTEKSGNCPVEHSNTKEIQRWTVFQSLGIYRFTVTIKILYGNLKSMCELPDAVSNVDYFAIASWKWVSTLYIVQIFSKAFLLLNEVWFLFPESSHTLSPKPWYLSLVLCVRSFMTLMTFRERTVWTAYLRMALEEGQRQSPALKENAPCHPHPYIFTEK